MSSRWPIGVGALVLAAAFATPASAQERGFIPIPLAEVSAGYTFMRDFEDIGSDRDGTNFPAGWFTSGGVNVTRWMGLVGEATGSYKNHFFDVSQGDERIDSDARVYTFMGGPRFFYKRGRFAPFAQVLAGAAHLRLNVKWSSGLTNGSETESTTDFSIQPGGGLNVYLTDSVGVRLAADYRTIMDFEEDTTYQNQFRLASGLIFQWGRR